METLIMWPKILQVIVMLALSPFLFGVINRTKAFFAGRKGASLFQLYFDICKLVRKGAVYSASTTWIFLAGPMAGLGAIIAASMILPCAGHAALISFDGDIILFIYLLGLARFFTVIAALDTGSSFEGMGASREVQFAVFAEPALFLSVAVFSGITGYTSLSRIFAGSLAYSWASHGPLICLVTGALFIIFLAENSRIPVDDPNTHLELTMIHEVMVLDHGGIDFAYILYGAALKFWLLGTLITGVLFTPSSRGWGVDILLFITLMIILAVVVGCVESTLARLRLIKVPHFLIIALALSFAALILTLR